MAPQRTSVETVRGPVALDALGRTLMHEHVVLLSPEALANFGHVWGARYWDEEAGVGDAVTKLRRLHEAGYATLVDATAIGWGRDVRRLARVNAQVDINIIVATGVYSFIELPPFLAYRSDDQIVELFVRELREGIDDTGIKAAFLKCCVEEHGIVGDIPRILSCVAAASKETESPVMVHTNASHQTGRLALDFLLNAGVAPQRIVIAHMGDSNDLGYQRAIADSGAWLGHDRFHIEHFNPDADRVRTLAALVSEGYAGQIHVGHDAGAFHDFMVGNPIFEGEVADWLHIPTTILPALLDAGVAQSAIDEMLVENPRRFFA
jgi:phosphotriesterase-related protein